MKKQATLATFVCVLSIGAQAGEAGTPAHQWSASATLVSDYMFKGMTQTWGRPALQGSIDYTHSSGFYVSLWASGVSTKVYAGSHAEGNLWVGYRNDIDPDWSYDFGVLEVFYPGGNYNKIKYAALPSQKYDFTEAFVSVTYKWLTVKYAQVLTDLLGFNEKTGYTGGSRGSNYLDLSVDVPLGDDYVLGLHAGRQNVTTRLAAPTPGGSTNPDFKDYRVSLGKRFADGWSGSLEVSWNDNRAFFDGTPSNHDIGDTRDVGRRRLVLSVGKSF